MITLLKIGAQCDTGLLGYALAAGLHCSFALKVSCLFYTALSVPWPLHSHRQPGHQYTNQDSALPITEEQEKQQLRAFLHVTANKTTVGQHGMQAPSATLQLPSVTPPSVANHPGSGSLGSSSALLLQPRRKAYPKVLGSIPTFHTDGRKHAQSWASVSASGPQACDSSPEIPSNRPRSWGVPSRSNKRHGSLWTAPIVKPSEGKESNRELHRPNLM